MSGEEFSAKFRLVLKVLTISRVAVAKGVGVDKSLVGRWVSGEVQPTEHNRARLTSFISSFLPNFSLCDWDRSLIEFAEMLGVDQSSSLALENSGEDIPLFPPDFVERARRTTARRGKAYEGFWQTTRPSVIMAGTFFRDHGMMRLERDGILCVRMANSGLIFEGWGFLAEGSLFVSLYDATGGTPLFLIFHGVPLPKAEVLDGLLLMSALNAERTPAAIPILLERTGDLSGDRAADDARCANLFDEESIVEAATLPETVVNYLIRDIGPEAARSGGDLFLTASKALARGSTTGPLRG
jgi:hypothetical protein